MMKAMPVGSADRSRGALVRIGQCGLAAALLCLSAPGHAEPGPELIEAAEGEGELTAYIALANEVAQAWFEDFSEKYGIEVQTYRASTRSEEHTSELQSLMRISYAVICLKKNKKPKTKP